MDVYMILFCNMLEKPRNVLELTLYTRQYRTDHKLWTIMGAESGMYNHMS